MMAGAKRVALALVVGLCAASIGSGDGATVEAKISAAQAAVSADKGMGAAGDVNEVAQMIEKDAEGAGEYAQAFAAWQAKAAKQLAEDMAKGAKIREMRLVILAARTADLYGALIPAGKGQLGAVAEYLKKVAASSPEIAKEALEASAKLLSDAVAGKADKRAALGMMKVTLGSSVPIAKAMELADLQKPKPGGAWVMSVAEYMGLEEKAADMKSAEGIADLKLEVRAMAEELEWGRNPGAEELKMLLAGVQETILDAYKVPAVTEEKEAEAGDKDAGTPSEKPKEQ